MKITCKIPGAQADMEEPGSVARISSLHTNAAVASPRKRDPAIEARNQRIRDRFLSNEIVHFIPASAMGEKRTNELLATGFYYIWRVDRRGELWIRFGPKTEQEN